MLVLTKLKGIIGSGAESFRNSFMITDEQIIQIFTKDPGATGMLLEEGYEISYTDRFGVKREREGRLPQGTYEEEGASETYHRELRTLDKECLHALLHHQAYEEWNNCMIFTGDEGSIVPSLFGLVSVPHRQPAYLLDGLAMFGDTLEEIKKTQQQIARELFASIDFLGIDFEEYDRYEVERRFENFIEC